MKKKPFITILTTLTIGLVLSIGLSYVTASWNEPNGTPPANNLPVPVNVGNIGQVKTGDLSVNTFLANSDAEFDQGVYFKQTIFGGIPSDPSCPSGQHMDTTPSINKCVDNVLHIGGVDRNHGSDTDPDSYRVVTNVNGDVKSTGTLGTDELKTVTDAKGRLCADDKGHIVFCPQYAPYVPVTEKTITWANESYDTDIALHVPGDQDNLVKARGTTDRRTAGGQQYYIQSLKPGCATAGVCSTTYTVIFQGMGGSVIKKDKVYDYNNTNEVYTVPSNIDAVVRVDISTP